MGYTTHDQPQLTPSIAALQGKMSGFAPKDKQFYNLWSDIFAGKRIPGVMSPGEYAQLLTDVSQYISQRGEGLDLAPFMATYVTPYLTAGSNQFRAPAISFWAKHKGHGGGDARIGLQDVQALTSTMGDPTARRSLESYLLQQALATNPDDLEVWKTASDFADKISGTYSSGAFDDYYNVMNMMFAMAQESPQIQERLAQAGVAIQDPQKYLPDLSGTISPLARERWEPIMRNYIATYGGGATPSARGTGAMVYPMSELTRGAGRLGEALQATGEGLPGQETGVPAVPLSFDNIPRYNLRSTPNAGPLRPEAAAVEAVAKDAIMTALSDPLGSKSGTETRNAIKTLILDRQLKGPSGAKTWLVDAEGRAKPEVVRAYGGDPANETSPKTVAAKKKIRSIIAKLDEYIKKGYKTTWPPDAEL